MATEKFKEATHFIVNECSNDPGRLGATRLNKALWNADVLAFKKNGQSITGDCYVKRQNGPVPSHILSTLNELKAEGLIVTREPEYQYDTRKLISIKEPETTALSDDEKDALRAAVDFVCGKTTTTISELTHDIVWDAAAIGESIPLFATLASRQGEITGDVLRWADASIRGGDVL